MRNVQNIQRNKRMLVVVATLLATSISVGASNCDFGTGIMEDFDMTKLDSAYRINIQKQEGNVSKERYGLSKIINCVKFCAAFELAMRGLAESGDSTNRDIFLGLTDFAPQLD
ncbi:hypothetical protein ANN_00808 [Periplaneta americana]|uniref:Uncharacterized protein n=1 Tax=Periplaneta americana TaxID=6978 RepID=A0ABQ8TRU1_PERAM|nr:hypothetical protein ANN_00808 [Periplaneta americana]